MLKSRKKPVAAAEWKNTNILKINEILDDKYKIIRKISQGGFGQVFEVSLVKNNIISLSDTQFEAKQDLVKLLNLKRGSKLAIKVESHQLSVAVLRQEYEILSKLRMSNHFMKCLQFGDNTDYRFMVQTLGGMDLSRLQRSRPDTCFTLETAFRLAYEMLMALNYLHDTGIVHKDIKPSNYVLSPFEDTTLVLVDFGIAKRVLTANGSLLKSDQAKNVKFVGTHVYASLRSQDRHPTWKSDDLISLYYSLLTLTKLDILPWRKLKERDDIIKKKREYDASKMHKIFPEEAGALLDQYYEYVNSLQYGDEVNYEFIYEMFENLFDEWNVSDSDPFDWQEAGATEAAQQADAVTKLVGAFGSARSNKKNSENNKSKRLKKDRNHESFSSKQNDVAFDRKANSRIKYDETLQSDMNHRIRNNRKYVDDDDDDNDNINMKNSKKNDNQNWLNKMILNRFFCMRI